MSLVQTLDDGDMALLDMGAEYHFYGSDITCSFPVSIWSFFVYFQFDCRSAGINILKTGK